MSPSGVRIELHYLPCIEYFACLLAHDPVWLEAGEFYEKQSYRNRCYVLAANGVIKLTVPVIKGNRKQFIRDVRIDYSQKWVTDHWRTIASAYGKAPFFEYLADDLARELFRQPPFLFDLNWGLLTSCLRLAGIEKKIQFASVYPEGEKRSENNLRSAIHPKKGYVANELYRPVAYVQNFGNNFVPNLSIIDLLFCEGNRTQQIIRQSLIAQ